MYLLKRKKEKSIDGKKSHGLVHHIVATWQFLLTKRFSHTYANILLRGTNSIRFSTETNISSITKFHNKIFIKEELKLLKCSCNRRNKSFCPLAAKCNILY